MNRTEAGPRPFVRWGILVAAGAAVGAMALLGGLGLPCGFHRLTGWPCPACGGTRALAALAQADWRASLEFNPLVVLGILAVPLLRLNPRRLPALLLIGGAVWLWQIWRT